ncbi:hypothetical protein [Corynebacterium kalidii]|uniref:Uncharacterized protein n=1 Tax=Corynebacterium kalidii TaxID=2931982 RepID=A0A9X1WGY3_9CORY|nr:hypothetical protein [Corynebacterium kalidii]MCJ7857963.1 hypothetical protein [Corynebacterium kalidii]
MQSSAPQRRTPRPTPPRPAVTDGAPEPFPAPAGAQPTTNPGPPFDAGLHRFLRDPRYLVAGTAGLLLVITFIIAGTVYALKAGPQDDINPNRDFVLSDDEVRDSFSIDNAFADCRITEEFYAEVHVEDVTLSESGEKCVGTFTDTGDEVGIHPNVYVQGGSISRESHVKIGAENWSRVSNPPGSSSDVPCAISRTTEPGLITLTSDDSCSNLEPIARHLQNLIDRKKWIDLRDSGSSRPAPPLLDPFATDASQT